MSEKIRIVMFEPNQPARTQWVSPDFAFKDLLGNYADHINLVDLGVQIYFREDHMEAFPELNRGLITAKPLTELNRNPDFVIDMEPEKTKAPLGRYGLTPIHGPFFLARADLDGNTVSLTPEDIETLAKLFNEPIMAQES